MQHIAGSFVDGEPIAEQRVDGMGNHAAMSSGLDLVEALHFLVEIFSGCVMLFSLLLLRESDGHAPV